MARRKSTGKMEMIIVQSQSTWLHCQVLHRHECYPLSILTRALDFKKDGPLTGHLFLASALYHFSCHFVSINLQASKGEVRYTRSPNCQQAAGPHPHPELTLVHVPNPPLLLASQRLLDRLYSLPVQLL